MLLVHLSKIFKGILDHYFNSVFNLFYLLDAYSGIDDTLYVEIIMAQLSTYELLLIFYHGILHESKYEKRVIEGVQLFKSIRPDELVERSHYSLYEESAYKRGYPNS